MTSSQPPDKDTFSPPLGPPAAPRKSAASPASPASAAPVPPHRTPRSVAGLLLAAGGGRRLGGRPKALLRHRGELLVERGARTLRQAGCRPVYVVLGAAREEVRARAALPDCHLVDSPHWQQGLSASLRAGLAALHRGPADAAVVLLVDQPHIGPEAVARLTAAHSGGASLAAACYGGRPGHPVLLGREHWEAVATRAREDRGARDYLRAHADEVALVECSDVATPDDIDLPADLARLRDDPP